MSREKLPFELQEAGMRAFVGNIEYAVRDARYFAQYARHYRAEMPRAIEPPIHVGAVALGMNLTGEMEWFWGANQNLSPADENPTKMCAERVALQKMLNFGYQYLIGIVAAGTPQPDKQSGRSSLVLPTCGLCRPVIHEIGDEDYTLIGQSHPTLNIHEIDKLSEQTNKHDRGEDINDYTILQLGDTDFNLVRFEWGLRGLSPSSRLSSVADFGRHAIGATLPAGELAMSV